MAWGALIGAVGGLLGSRSQSRANRNAIAAQQAAQRFTDQGFNFGFGSGGVGSNYSNFSFAQPQRDIQAGLYGSAPWLLGGGMFNDPRLQAALQGNDIAGALGQANAAFQLPFSTTAFGQMGDLAATAGGLGGLYGLQAAQGLQDPTGAQGLLFGGGFGNIAAAGNTGGLAAQRTNLLRQQATQGGLLDQAINRLQNRQFATGRLGNQAGVQGENTAFLNALAQQDLGFQLAGQDLGFQEAQRLQNLGLSQIGAGSQLFGQNIGLMGQYGNMANQFLGLAGGLEGQQFGQNLQATQAAQTAGLNRLSAAQGLFGLGSDLFSQQYGLGLAGAQAGMGFDELALQSVLGLRQAEASRISGAGNTGYTPITNTGAGGFLAGLGQSVGQGVNWLLNRRNPVQPISGLPEGYT